MRRKATSLIVGGTIASALLWNNFNLDTTSIRGTSSKVHQSHSSHVKGTKEIKVHSIGIKDFIPVEHDTLAVTLDLNGLCVLPARAGEVRLIRKSGETKSVSLSEYVQNCSDGSQKAIIPLSDFYADSTPSDITAMEMQVWYPTLYDVEVTSVETYNRVLGVTTTKSPKPGRSKLSPKPSVVRSPSPSPLSTPAVSPSPSPTPSPSPLGYWSLRSISSMKESKDRVCGQRDAVYIDRWVKSAKALGITHIAVETPYDNPTCGDAGAYTKRWVDAIRANGLSVWHRHMPLAFEGIYNTPKDPSRDYIQEIVRYIRTNPGYFRNGDIFTPVPEPQNGGIAGVTYCPTGVCIFRDASHFNAWLRDAMTQSTTAFSNLGLTEVRVGYWGFDGFVAWGDNNPDWNGILEDATVAQMGSITIDHYPEIVGDTMQNDLNELQSRYPNTPIVIGEWGTISGTDWENQVNSSMPAAKRPGVVGFGYWHHGVGGNESLVAEELTPLSQYDDVARQFTSQ